MDTIKILDKELYSYTFENASPYSNLPLEDGQRLVCVTRNVDVYDRLKRVEVKTRLGYTFDSALHWAQTGDTNVLVDNFVMFTEEECEEENEVVDFWGLSGDCVRMTISNQEELDLTLRHSFVDTKCEEGYTLASVYEWALSGDESVLVKG